ncbi:hypothetical protein NQZ68_039480 [Dissostichus eleginoides]|nr:hypothetical protein NQZ68_039480 [Dissostichus eleginoides]
MGLDHEQSLLPWSCSKPITAKTTTYTTSDRQNYRIHHLRPPKQPRSAPQTAKTTTFTTSKDRCGGFGGLRWCTWWFWRSEVVYVVVLAV